MLLSFTALSRFIEAFSAGIAAEMYKNPPAETSMISKKEGESKKKRKMKAKEI